MGTREFQRGYCYEKTIFPLPGAILKNGLEAVSLAEAYGINSKIGYGGTKQSTATALGEHLTPEEIKRCGTGSATNKAFGRYFQPRRAKSVKVVSTIKELQKKQAGKVVKMR